jgi:hypothetical protein
MAVHDEPGQGVVPVRKLPAHVEERYRDGRLVRGTADGWNERGGVVPPARVPVHLGGAVRVERVLEQPDVTAVHEAILAYGPTGAYRYDIGLTTANPWGDQDVFHAVKVWWRPEPDGRVFTASGRVTGEPDASAVAVTVRGIMITLVRLQAIAEDRDTHPARTYNAEPDQPPEWPGEPIRTFRPIKDNPQA